MNALTSMVEAPAPPEDRRDRWPKAFSITSDFDSPTDLALVTTLVLLVLYGDQHWYVHILAAGSSFAIIALPSLRYSGPLWSLITAVLFAGNWLAYWSADNHKHLIAYWTLAIALACHARTLQAAQETLALASRWLIAAAMGFAVLWKLKAPDYLTGEFFEYALIFDDRFENVARILGGLTPEMVEENVRARSVLVSWVPAAPELLIRVPDSLRALARAMTYWVITIEGIVALAFACPDRWRLGRARDGLLILFLLTTYLVAPVYGFAYVLIAMGMAQSRARSAALKGYTAAFIVIQLYDAPWAATMQLTDWAL